MATTNILIIIIVAISLLSSLNSEPDACLNDYCPEDAASFNPNSTYGNNLKHLLNSLSSNGSSAGYFADAVGDIPDRVYGNVLCRGDISIAECQECLSTTLHILEGCHRKVAKVWNVNCFLSYSEQRLITTYGVNFWYRKGQMVTTEWTWFNQSFMTLMHGLADYATYNKSKPPPPLFATGQIELTHTEFPMIYGLVQCTRDVSEDECNVCLNMEIKRLLLCDFCDHSIGVGAYGENCNLRYEVAKFYEGPPSLVLPAITTTSPSPSPSPSPQSKTPPSPTTFPPSQGLPPAWTPTPQIRPSKTPPSPSPPAWPPTPQIQGKKTNETKVIIGIAIPLGAVLLISLVGCCIWYFKRKRALKTFRTKELAPKDSLLFDLSTIKNITDNFSEANKLGEGGFGKVYKGTLPDGQKIAVKRLSESSAQGVRELNNEVVLLAKLQHRNLVRLLGVCEEGEEKILIYEFVQNKSLDTILFDTSKKYQLNWEKRYMIIKRIARGMLYLHEESQYKIIHRDLKASNILLDVDMNPKISDFGLARLFKEDMTHAITSRVIGTLGYMSPEYAMRGYFSEKSDAFSFGVIVLEIITGRKINARFGYEKPINLLEYVWRNWENGTILEVVDPSFGEQYHHDEATACIKTGLLCVQENPADRPTMSTVILMLNSHLISAQPPSRPALATGYTIVGVTNSSEVNTDQSNIRSTHASNEISNEISVVKFEPR